MLETFSPKYYRSKSDSTTARVSSPFFSTWYKEDIIADQRYERRRKMIPSRRKSDQCEMDTDQGEGRNVKRGKRQSDCRICVTELVDWTDIVSMRDCSHLYHTHCYHYWLNKTKAGPDACPVCGPIPTISPPQITKIPAPLPALRQTSSHTIPPLLHSSLPPQHTFPTPQIFTSDLAPQTFSSLSISSPQIYPTQYNMGSDAQSYPPVGSCTMTQSFHAPRVSIGNVDSLLNM